VKNQTWAEKPVNSEESELRRKPVNIEKPELSIQLGNSGNQSWPSGSEEPEIRMRNH
jgi:hypothetical protein